MTFVFVPFDVCESPDDVPSKCGRLLLFSFDFIRTPSLAEMAGRKKKLKRNRDSLDHRG